ncbi:hypothetical protein V1512DRAFT_224110 [Lipomyces arxii]|uniref:uncharacterized protein n=1 Tax=Lipomyces arxii TaxID=56418 RepID=UPI0034CE3D16
MDFDDSLDSQSRLASFQVGNQIDNSLDVATSSKRRKQSVFPIRRRRLIRTCVNCHRRKVKCDKLTPACNNCINLGLNCKYYDEIGNDQKTDNLDASHEIYDGQNVKAGSDIEDDAVDVTEPPENAGYISVDLVTGTTRYANGVFWGAFFKELADVNSMLESRSAAFNMDAMLQGDEISALFVAQIGSNPAAALKIVYSLLPSRDVSDNLVARYFTSIHPAVPILNRFRFEQAYSAFWANYIVNLPIDSQFLPLLFVTYYTAMISLCDSAMFDIFKFPDEFITVQEAAQRQKGLQDTVKNLRVLQSKFKLATKMALAACKFPSQPTMPCFQASTIFSSCSQAHVSDEGTGSIAVLIRVAQMMGIHRDPSNFSGKFTVEDTQARRLLWWQLVHLDYVTSMSQGLPPLFHNLESDVQFPSEHVIINNESLDQIDPYIVLMNAVAEGSALNCKILSAVYGVQKCSAKQIDQLDKEILELHPRIETKWRQMMKLKDDDVQGNTFKDWAFYFMHAVMEKSYTYLHHPGYLNDSGAETEERQSGKLSIRMKVLKSAVNTLYYYLGFSKMPDFLTFISFIRPVHPFHAIIIVLQDLYLNPPSIPVAGTTSIEDERLRIVEQVFQVLHYLKIMEMSAAVRNMWHLLNKLRTGTWLKIGYIHPIGLPLVSARLPLEYQDIAPTTTPSSESVPVHTQVFAKYLDSELSSNSIYTNQPSVMYRGEANANVNDESVLATFSAAPMPMSIPIDLSTSSTTPKNVADSMERGDLKPSNDTLESEEFYSFAAKMEDSNLWNNWDDLLKS